MEFNQIMFANAYILSIGTCQVNFMLVMCANEEMPVKVYDDLRNLNVLCGRPMSSVDEQRVPAHADSHPVGYLRKLIFHLLLFTATALKASIIIF